MHACTFISFKKYIKCFPYLHFSKKTSDMKLTLVRWNYFSPKPSRLDKEQEKEKKMNSLPTFSNFVLTI